MVEVMVVNVMVMIEMMMAMVTFLMEIMMMDSWTHGTLVFYGI